MIYNFTPNTVTVLDDHGIEHVFSPDGRVARVEMKTIPSTILSDGTPTSIVTYGEAILPTIDYLDDIAIIAIVSTMFADAYRIQQGFDNIRLLVPDYGPTAVRKDGQIIAVRSLIWK